VVIVPFQAIMRTVLMEALLRETCNARMRAEPHGCILLNLSLHLAAVGCTLQWTLGAEINKTTSITVCNNIKTNITSQWRHYRV